MAYPESLGFESLGDGGGEFEVEGAVGAEGDAGDGVVGSGQAEVVVGEGGGVGAPAGGGGGGGAASPGAGGEGLGDERGCPQVAGGLDGQLYAVAFRPGQTGVVPDESRFAGGQRVAVQSSHAEVVAVELLEFYARGEFELVGLGVVGQFGDRVASSGHCD